MIIFYLLLFGTSSFTAEARQQKHEFVHAFVKREGGEEYLASARAELERAFPEASWKVIGLSDDKRVPVITLKVPSFVSWDKECHEHHFKGDVEYCAPGEVQPVLKGTFRFKEHEHVLRIALEAWVTKKPREKYFLSLHRFSDWEQDGALLSKAKVTLGGQEAFLGEIEDKSGKSKNRALAQTLYKFELPLIGGTFSLIEFENTADGRKDVLHRDRVFSDVFKKVIGSFKYEVGTQPKDGKQK